MKLWISLIVIAVVIFGGYLLMRPAQPTSSLPDEFATTTSMTDQASSTSATTTPAAPTEKTTKVTFKTSMGDIVLELFTDKMPITTANFISLAENGFYDGTRFHRVIPGFMIQGGDPFTKDVTKKDQWGTGGPGYTIKDEFVAGLSNVRGTIAMANTGRPNSGGSQFFINVVDNTGLDFDKPPMTSSHPVFGRVISGMDVVDAIVNVPTEGPDRPVKDVVIQSVVVEK